MVDRQIIHPLRRGNPALYYSTPFRMSQKSNVAK